MTDFLALVQSATPMPLTQALLVLLIMVLVVLGVALLCIFIPRIRRFLLLLLASQIMMTYLGIVVIGSNAPGWSFGWILGTFWVIFFIGAVTLAYWSARRYDIIPPFKWRYFRVGRSLIGFLLLWGSQFLVISIFSWLFPQLTATTSANQAAVNALGAKVPLFFFAITVISAGFFEELVFRVGVFELLLPKHRKWAFVVSAVLFAAVHMQSAWTGQLTVLYVQSWIIYGSMALILTAFYYKYRNFYLNMTVHALLNFYVVLLMPYVIAPLLKFVWHW